MSRSTTLLVKKASGGKTKKQLFQGADVNHRFALRDDTGKRSSRL